MKITQYALLGPSGGINKNVLIVEVDKPVHKIILTHRTIVFVNGISETEFKFPDTIPKESHGVLHRIPLSELVSTHGGYFININKKSSRKKFKAERTFIYEVIKSETYEYLFSREFDQVIANIKSSNLSVSTYAELYEIWAFKKEIVLDFFKRLIPHKLHEGVLLWNWVSNSPSRDFENDVKNMLIDSLKRKHRGNYLSNSSGKRRRKKK